MLARYEPGATYAMHKDNYDSEHLRGSPIERRELTLILYVNDLDWQTDRDGGQLRIHSPNFVRSP